MFSRHLPSENCQGRHNGNPLRAWANKDRYRRSLHKERGGKAGEVDELSETWLKKKKLYPTFEDNMGWRSRVLNSSNWKLKPQQVQKSFDVSPGSPFVESTGDYKNPKPYFKILI